MLESTGVGILRPFRPRTNRVFIFPRLDKEAAGLEIMDDKNTIDLMLDISAGLASVGDQKRVEGSATAFLEEGYELSLIAGDEVEWSLQLRRIAVAVEISGKVTGSVTLSCYRCLKAFELPLSLPVREHALWLSDSDTEAGGETVDEYAVIAGVLDLLPVLRDAICLALPVQRVCSEDCKGLCPVCGTDLNVNRCDCQTRAVDARLKPLADLKKRLEEKDT